MAKTVLKFTKSVKGHNNARNTNYVLFAILSLQNLPEISQINDISVAQFGHI